MIKKSISIFFLISLFAARVEAVDLLASQLGINTKEFNLAKNNLSIPLQIVSESSCSFGDLDAIFFDLYHSADETKLLLTLEDFLSGEQKYFAKDLLGEQFDEKIVTENGFESSIELAELNSTKVLALYLCKDTSGKGSCSNKKAEDINSVVDSYNAEHPKGPDFVAEDKIYYFSFLIVNKNQVSVLESPLSENEYPILKQYLESKSISSADAEKIVTKIHSLNDILGSETLSLASTKSSKADVRILLPRLDSKRCYREKTAE